MMQRIKCLAQGASSVSQTSDPSIPNLALYPEPLRFSKKCTFTGRIMTVIGAQNVGLSYRVIFHAQKISQGQRLQEQSDLG